MKYLLIFILSSIIIFCGITTIANEWGATSEMQINAILAIIFGLLVMSNIKLRKE